MTSLLIEALAYENSLAVFSQSTAMGNHLVLPARGRTDTEDESFLRWRSGATTLV